MPLCKISKHYNMLCNPRSGDSCKLGSNSQPQVNRHTKQEGYALPQGLYRRKIINNLQNNQHLQTCKLTDQGMQRIDFPEFSNIECLVQQSATNRENSPPGSVFLWLGTLRAPMCLDRQRVAELVSVLQTWLDTGKLVESNT